MSCADFFIETGGAYCMKPIEQYDAHVQSYRNEQKRQERERIRRILQYLAQKRKQLTLERHPVSRIHYNIKMLNPTLVPPFAIKKVSFNSQVPSQTAQPVLNFKMPKYKLDIPDVKEFSKHSVDVVRHTFDYSYKECPIPIEFFDDTFIPHSFASSFSFSQKPLPNLETQKQSVLKQYDITTPILPDLSNVISPLQANPIKRSQVTYELDSSFISDLVTPLSIPYIHHTKLEYKAIITDIEFPLLSKKAPIMQQVEFDIQQLTGADVDLQHLDTRIATFNTEMEEISVPNCYKKFAIPVFDFSDTIEKLKKALIADRMQGE